MRFLVIVLVVQALLAATFIVLVATGNVPFVNDDSHEADGKTSKVDRFDSRAAYRLVQDQVGHTLRVEQPEPVPAVQVRCHVLAACFPQG